MLITISKLPDFIGLIGVLLILIAYFSSQFWTWTTDSILYLLANLAGSLFIAFSLLFHWNLSAFLIELAWSLISMAGLIRVFYKKIK